MEQHSGNKDMVGWKHSRTHLYQRTCSYEGTWRNAHTGKLTIESSHWIAYACTGMLAYAHIEGHRWMLALRRSHGGKLAYAHTGTLTQSRTRSHGGKLALGRSHWDARTSSHKVARKEARTEVCSHGRTERHGGKL
ncbi:hypothetical protein BGX38DRAFT_1275348 [Terfezia claveryi]|nr:hypothetical protein BGX38DRAFT_1275348 [Terfezia claveryi]